MMITTEDGKRIESEQAVRIYSPEKSMKHLGALFRELKNDCWQGRGLAWRLFVRDFKAQYSQTMLGYVWAFLPPLFASLTFVFLNSQGIVKIDGLDIPYPIFAMIGTMLWQTFVEAIQSPLQSILGAKSMLAKINFPREAILLAGVYMVITSTIIRLCLIFAVMFFWGISSSTGLLFLPIFLLGLIICGFSFGLLLVPFGGLYGDMARSIPIITQFWMLLTPVVYPSKIEGWSGVLMRYNPAAPLISSARACLVDRPIEQFGISILYIVLFSILAFIGVICFRLTLPHLIARMGS